MISFQNLIFLYSHSQEPLTADKIENPSASFSVYWKYFRSGGDILSLLTLFMSCCIAQLVYSLSTYWLSRWTEAEQLRSSAAAAALINNSTISDSFSIDEWFNQMDTMTGIYGFTAITICVFLFSIIRSVHFFLVCMKSSVQLHDQMFQSLIRSPLLFFDRNPIGK